MANSPVYDNYTDKKFILKNWKFKLDEIAVDNFS